MTKFLVPVAILVLAIEVLLGGAPISDDGPVDLAGPSVVESPGPVDGLELAPRLIIDGLDEPTDVVGAPSDDRIFVVEKAGLIRILEDGELLTEPYLDLTRWVGSRGNEQGLLSLLFHPDYQSNGRVFIFLTDKTGTSQLIELKTMSDNPDHADPRTIRSVLTIPQVGQYHQSGSMFFGPDGYLWVSLGDGGGIGDPEQHGQDPGNIDASIVRIDVDGSSPYAIPADNPFVNDPGGGLPEVWAFGLRNPWRITYDPETRLLYIPDVGQEGAEELNVVPINRDGYNFGWSIFEGTTCYKADSCLLPDQTLPVYQYLHNGNGCAIIGGRVYRGELMPELVGHYFFSDFCLGWVRSVVVNQNEVLLVKDWTRSRAERLGTVTTIGSDRHGELYVATLEGQIWRLELADH